jgi:NADP-dependent 3-hydroxy acid dehydrogenase YdfG
MSQVWFITGSSRGIGGAPADAVLAAGHRLVATARSPKQLSDLVERYGDRVGAVALDVTDERAALAAVQNATTRACSRSGIRISACTLSKPASVGRVGDYVVTHVWL